MGPDSTDLALLKYLDGEPDVVQAAAALCGAAARFRATQDALTTANTRLLAALAEAGVPKDDRAEIACAFLFLNHRMCEVSSAAHAEEGHDER
ncbi:hypothetical protein [Catenulispora pinisilvae]|uniref:hypothetical protein n=1 Tax=Catenulispora pinisilvae TaxID=2705253 RepID=UPI001891FF0A|nr:hypothetical protein [Catenulispora pinisilvae]